MQHHSVTSLETARSMANGLVGGGGGGGVVAEGKICICSVSYFLSMEGVGGENSLHWKANMVPLFSIMDPCYSLTGTVLLYANFCTILDFISLTLMRKRKKKEVALLLRVKKNLTLKVNKENCHEN